MVLSKLKISLIAFVVATLWSAAASAEGPLKSMAEATVIDAPEVMGLDIAATPELVAEDEDVLEASASALDAVREAEEIDDLVLEDLDLEAVTYKPTKKKVYKKKVIRKTYTPKYKKKKVIIVGHHHRHKTTIITTKKEPLDLTPDHVFSVGMRFGLIAMDDTSLSHETFEGAELGGVGGYIRGKFHDHMGLEFTVDIFGTDQDDYEQLSVPIMAGFMGHLFPDFILDLYGVAGGGIFFNSVKYQSPTGFSYSEDFTQWTGQLGAGLEVNLGALQLTSDVRWLFMESRPERPDDKRTVVPLKVSGESTSSGESDEITHALFVMVGIGGNF